MEASALELRQGTAPGKGLLNGSLLRLRSDEQLVELFRAGNDDAFCAIHDRYRKRLLAYAAQMLNGSGQDAEDALQEVFERAYFGLRAHDRDMALRAWLYRVAHNRCVDQLRRPAAAGTVEPDETESRAHDPVTVAEQRETLDRLIVDVGRLPESQRSALLLREMSGMSYTELASAMAVSVPAVKSLLVRARISLVAAGEARDTACSAIREDLVLAQDRGVRPGANARRHLRDCAQCRHFRRSMRSVSRNLTAVVPPIGAVGVLAKLLGGGGGTAGGGAVAGGAVAGGGSLVASGTVGATGVMTGGLAAGTAGHVAAIVAAALVTAGGAVAVQPSGAGPAVHRLIGRPAPAVAQPATPALAKSAPAPESRPTGGAAIAPPDAAAPSATDGQVSAPAAPGLISATTPPGGSDQAPTPPAGLPGSTSASTGPTSGTPGPTGLPTNGSASTSTAGGGASNSTGGPGSGSSAPSTSSAAATSPSPTSGSTGDS